MSEDKTETPIDLGIYGRAETGPAFGPPEIVAGILTAVWVVGLGFLFAVTGGGGAEGDPLRLVMIAVAVCLPVAVIWLGALTARGAQRMRDGAERIEAALDALRQAQTARSQSAVTVLQPTVERKLDEIVRAQKKTETALATFTSIRQAEAPAAAPGPAPPSAEEAEPRLALDTPPEPSGRAAIEDFIVALNFPETAEDAEGFRALRRAMRDRHAAKLIQASQDVLTFLSQDGIYMDDMTPDRSRPELWRRFAEGERGRQVAPLGGIRDRSPITLTAARMRRDPVFRDTVHHFLRTFDHTFAAFEKVAGDADIAALTDTRTARAFMLLGRVAGVFD